MKLADLELDEVDVALLRDGLLRGRERILQQVTITEEDREMVRTRVARLDRLLSVLPATSF